jgi:hypothetical protein
MARGLLVAVIAALFGALVGGTMALAWQGGVLRPEHRPAPLAAQALTKASAYFVAQRRIPGSGVTFYDQPKPYGDWLCRVKAIYVPEKVLTGKLTLPQDRWEDDVDASELYGVWREPHVGPAKGDVRVTACAGFRDFDHTFIVKNSADPERGAFLLDSIIARLRSGSLNVPVSCTGPGQRGQRESCDATILLKSITLQNLRQVDAVSEQRIEGGMRRTDLLWLPRNPKSPDEPSAIALKVVSDQTFGKQSASEGDLRSLDISVECFC